METRNVYMHVSQVQENSFGSAAGRRVLLKESGKCIAVTSRKQSVTMAQRVQLPDGTVVLSNRCGRGPFEDCQRFVRVVLPQGVDIEGVYKAAHGVLPERYWL